MSLAHSVTGPGLLWQTWHADPGVIVALLPAAGAYLFGMWRLHARGSRIPLRDPLAWITALVVTTLALTGPLDAAAHDLFAAHMVQHLVLILLVAPLLVAARPLRAIGAAFPVAVRRTSVQVAHTSIGKTIRSPLLAGLAMVAALALWHIPGLYGAALTSDVVHLAEHASFLGAAVVFWTVVLGRRPAGTRAALTFAVFLFGGALGALLTFSGSTFYPGHGEGPAAWGLTALEDQQLAGVIMWVPSGAIYVIAFAALFLAWMRRLEARMPSRPPVAQGGSDG